MSKTVRYLILGGIALVLLVLLTSPKIKLFQDDPKTVQGGTQADMRLPVNGYIVRPEQIDRKILSTGTVIANEEVDLRSESTGKIERIYFTEGTRVKNGDLLAKINDSELQAQLSKLISQEKLAKDKEERRKQMLEKSLISSEDYEIALNELSSIKADIELMKARIIKTELRAPFEGIIGLRYVSEGSYVSPSTRIASLQNISQIKIDFSIPEKYANDVQKGQSIQFAVAGSAARHQGKIFAIEPKIDPVTRTIQLRAISENRDARILPGAFAQVEFILERINDALMVPTEALIPELQGQKVFVYKSGLAQPQLVETGIRNETKVQITSGLSSADTLIASGTLQLRPGLPVRLTEIK